MVNAQHEKIKEEFSRAKAYAEEYQGNSPKSHLFNTRLIRVAEMLRKLEAGKVLDAGCGPAFIGESFRNRDITYCGLDLSPHMIRECAEHYGDDTQYTFLLGIMESLPFTDNSFDAVLCLGALEYILDVGAVLEEIKRVLKPHGLFIVTMQNPYSPYRLWQRFIYWKARNLLEKIIKAGHKPASEAPAQKSGSRFFKSRSETDLRKALTLYGFEIKDLVYYDFNIFLSPLDHVLSGLSVLVSSRLEVLARSSLKSLGTGYIFKCQKK